MLNPEKREQEQSPYAFIDAYVNKLFAGAEPIINTGLAPVRADELRALEPSFPKENVDCSKPLDWDRPEGTRKPRFLGGIALRILDRLARSGQRVLPDPELASIRQRANLFDDRIDLMLEFKQLQIEGGITIDGNHVTFAPENKLIEITIADSGAHNDSKRLLDHVKYLYTPLSQELSSELVRGPYSTPPDYRIPLISTEKSDIENLQAVFSAYPPEVFSHK